MKRLFVPIWLLSLVCLFHFSCEDESDYRVTQDSDMSGIIEVQNFAGNWSAIKVEYIVDEISQDVSEYFDELQITINKNQSCCNINGCNSWATTCDWENSENSFYNYFKNQDSGNVIFIKIISIKPSKMIAEVENKTPEFKLFPDEDREGIYRLTLVAI
jgi:hypothetical protein